MKIVVNIDWNPNAPHKKPRTIGAQIQRQKVLEQTVRNAVGEALMEHTDVRWSFTSQVEGK